MHGYLDRKCRHEMVLTGVVYGQSSGQEGTIEMDTRVNRVISKYKILVEQEMSLSDVILHLNREGLSIMDSIKIVRILYKLPLGEAKQVVSSHQVWETTLRSNEPFHEGLENIVNSI
jgi:ribosomal protein L7/L12